MYNYSIVSAMHAHLLLNESYSEFRYSHSVLVEANTFLGSGGPRAEELVVGGGSVVEDVVVVPKIRMLGRCCCRRS